MRHPLLILRALYRPLIFVAPATGKLGHCRVGWMVVSHINRECGLVEYPCVDPLHELVKPAHGFMAPLHLRHMPSVVRKVVIPRSDHRFYGCFDVL